MNVILTGLRGTGKSSIGAALARLLDFAFVDTDMLIEKLAGHRVAEIVAQHGWSHFRTLERRVVVQVATADRHVIAAGGGTLMEAENVRLLKAHGLVVLLLCDVSILQRRIAPDSNRPSLTGQGTAETELIRVWNERRDRYYAVADLTYDVSAESNDAMLDVERKARAILALLQNCPSFWGGMPTPENDQRGEGG